MIQPVYPTEDMPSSLVPLLSPSFQRLAMEKYIEGVQLEKQGSHSQALTCFQQAFKLDPDVDVTYSYQKRRKSSSASSSSSLFSSKTEEDEQDTGHVTTITVSSAYYSIDDLIDHICQEEDLSYHPLKKLRPVWIAKLPDEIIVHILCHLVLQSLGSVAQFALVCRSFFLLTRSATLWRAACESLFSNPAMTFMQAEQYQSSIVHQSFEGQWLRMIKERPRIRYDGVYIATCQYVRPGASDTAWTRPVHLVTYYRYLRFFPDGRVLNFISNDEPIQVVHLMVPSFTKRQFFRGTFSWDGHTQVRIQMKEDGRDGEAFVMNLQIKHPYGHKSATKRRFYKLAWDSYTSRKVNQGDEGPLNTYNIELMKPFIFSAVNSYRVDYTKEKPAVV
ncbi:hypothetical protein BC941DRAFT_175453 [Chlamydoabsidia padenii]|nr:hypothetical protein BC941DRAFT_175453 [Chlamydoabsidia padenii]